jgi:hypothetical protein
MFFILEDSLVFNIWDFLNNAPTADIHTADDITAAGAFQPRLHHTLCISIIGNITTIQTAPRRVNPRHFVMLQPMHLPLLSLFVTA